MSARSERDVLVEYATRDAETLSLALRIAEAQADICTKVIADFIAVLVPRLAECLGDQWAVRAGTPEQMGATYALYLRAEYRQQPGAFTLVICGDGKRYPKKMYVAVRTGAGGEHPTLKVELDAVARGESSEWSIWYRYLEDRHSWWGSSTTTPQLLRNTETVDYFLTYLERLARAVERGLRTPIPN